MNRPLSLLSLSLLASLGCGSEVVTDPSVGSGGGGGSSTTEAASTGAGGPVLDGPCTDEGTLRCGPDDRSILQCLRGRYRDGGACEPGAACQDVQGFDAVACGDVLLGLEGAPCVSAAAQVCDFDREVTLGCEDGIWRAFIHCAPARCVNVPREAGELCSGTACEGCGYTVGDRCSFPEGTVNCSTDDAQIVGCNAGVVTLFEDCAAGGLACTFSGGTITCQ